MDYVEEVKRKEEHRIRSKLATIRAAKMAGLAATRSVDYAEETKRKDDMIANAKLAERQPLLDYVENSDSPLSDTALSRVPEIYRSKTYGYYSNEYLNLRAANLAAARAKKMPTLRESRSVDYVDECKRNKEKGLKKNTIESYQSYEQASKVPLLGESRSLDYVEECEKKNDSMIKINRPDSPFPDITEPLPGTSFECFAENKDEDNASDDLQQNTTSKPKRRKLAALGESKSVDYVDKQEHLRSRLAAKRASRMAGVHASRYVR